MTDEATRFSPAKVTDGGQNSSPDLKKQGIFLPQEIHICPGPHIPCDLLFLCKTSLFQELPANSAVAWRPAW